MRLARFIAIYGTLVFVSTALAEPVGMGAGVSIRDPRAYNPGPNDNLIPVQIVTGLPTVAELFRIFEAKSFATAVWGSSPAPGMQEFELELNALPNQWVQLSVSPTVTFYRRLEMPEWLLDPSHSHSNKEIVRIERVRAWPGTGAASKDGILRLKVISPTPELKGALRRGRYDAVMRSVVTYN